MIRHLLVVSGTVLYGSFVGTHRVAAQTLFFEDFDADHSADWITNIAGVGTHSVDYFFDYSTVGIPPAPNSVGGSTRGLKLQANTDPATQPAPTDPPSGLSVSPLGGDFTGNYRLRFDMWLNYNGQADGTSGNGSTQITCGGIGTLGASVQIAGRTPDCIYFGASGDGGSVADYRAYSPGSGAPGYQDASGVFAAGGRNNTLPYYSVFGGASAPAAQLALFPQQAQITPPGAQGFVWRDVVIEWLDTTVTFTIDGLLIATVDTTTFNGTSGTNILFNQFDINSNASTDPNAPALLFGLIDNIFVEVPEPSALAGLAIGLLAICSRRRLQPQACRRALPAGSIPGPRPHFDTEVSTDLLPETVQISETAVLVPIVIWKHHLRLHLTDRARCLGDIHCERHVHAEKRHVDIRQHANFRHVFRVTTNEDAPAANRQNVAIADPLRVIRVG
jgi:PEP-CTERM motif